MFSRKKPSHTSDNKTAPVKRASASVISVIASDMHVIGNIISEGTIDIDGHIEGNVRCRQATVRKNGHIKGDLVAEQVSVYGKVQGLVKARSVNFFRGCRVEGVIQHETITIEDGAFVDGRFKRAEQLSFFEGEAEETPAANNRHPFMANAFPSTSDDETGNVTSMLKDDAEEETEKKGKSRKEEKPALRMLDNLKLIGDSN